MSSGTALQLHSLTSSTDPRPAQVRWLWSADLRSLMNKEMFRHYSEPRWCVEGDSPHLVSLMCLFFFIGAHKAVHSSPLHTVFILLLYIHWRWMKKICNNDFNFRLFLTYSISMLQEPYGPLICHSFTLSVQRAFQWTSVIQVKMTWAWVKDERSFIAQWTVTFKVYESFVLMKRED